MIREEGAPRILPGLDPLNRPFWTGGARGELLVARCGACDVWQHPPQDFCQACGGRETAPQPVSGKGRVVTFTINRQAWLPGMAVPFVLAAVELIEQAGLFLIVNIVGVDPEQVRAGMAVTVDFIAQDDIFLPVFRPDRGWEAHR
ncbi:OB-fold domain-containing protein [Sphingobium sp. Sx8-8]|uniref:Zn-ribbon domain-containing OB-fold protein n=1 Tax=Sphingobium sp. Sx8-8 TaxID=2933617 RepID=UPI001F594807|nr:OB-fold domain-containing protein [Sphingobium sp. Sx8-8]